MKLKNFLLGASLALCGGAFSQDAKVYLKDQNVMLHVSSCSVSQDADGNTTFDMNVIASAPGEQPGGNEPQGRWYYGHPGGYTGPGGPWQTICGWAPNQCVWTSWQ